MREIKTTDTSLLDASQIPTWIFCPHTLSFLYVNEAAVNTYGYSRKEFATMTLKDIRAHEDVQQLLQDIDTGVLPDITSPQTGRWRHRSKDGRLFYVELFASYIEYNDCPARLVQAIDINQKVLDDNRKTAVNALLQSKQGDIDHLLAAINEVVWIAYTDNRQLLYINAACIKMPGYTPAELLADSQLFYKAIHPEDRQLFENSFERMLQTGKDESEFRIIHKDGSIHYLKCSTILRKSLPGEPDVYCGIATDITAVKKEQERADNILNSITDGFFVLDKDYRFTYCNTAYKNMFDGAAAELEGKGYWEIFPKAKSQKFFTEYTRAIAQNSSVHFEEYATSLQKWVKVSAYPMQDGLAVYFTDINEEKQLKDAMARQEQNLNALINNTEDLIWSMDRNHCIISVNNACREYIDKTLNWKLQPGGKAAIHGMSGEELEKWLSYYNRAFNGESFKATQTYSLPDNTAVYWEVTFNPIPDQHGNIIGASCFATDITQHRNHMIHIEMQNARLKDIAQMQSHQVRGPLATIMGLQQLINTSNPADPINEEVLNGIQNACDMLDAMIRNIDKKTMAIWPEV
jgi:PAS domain S-box-containing protein